MTTRIIILFFAAIATLPLWAQETANFIQKDISVSPLIDGTILTPERSDKSPLVIIIAGSGPTDRNGNQQMMKNNSLRYLAEGLYQEGIASFRYDKRIIKQMKDRTINEESIRFSDFIQDAEAVIDYFKRSNAFSKIYVLGHSQGSTVGMVAAQKGADGFISIAGPGRSIDDVIVEQLSQQAPGLEENARKAFDDLRVNGVAQNYSPGLASIFRPSIQPFIRTWMEYDPSIEIKKLNIPVLLVAGTKDLQVLPSEGTLLKEAKPEATYHEIESMNHILKRITGDDLVNQKSYNETNRPVMPELITVVADFINR